MEKDLDTALELVKDSVRVEYISLNSKDVVQGFGKLIIDKSKLDGCPESSKIINRFEKKVSRTSALKVHKHTRQLCILILASVGYGVNASIFSDISDIFIEKCWECIQYVSYTVSDPAKHWLTATMDGRSPPSYSALFCPRKKVPDRVSIESKFEDRLKSTVQIDMDSIQLPKTVWHKDDCVMNTIIAHLKLGSRLS